MKWKLNSQVMPVVALVVGVMCCLSMVSTSTQAASISATPSSNTVGVGDSFAVEFFMNFGASEAPQAIQVLLELVDADPVVDPTTFTVPGGVVLTTPLAGWVIPASSLNALIAACPGPPGCSTPQAASAASYFAAGTDFVPKPAGSTLSLGVLTFTADAAGTMDVEVGFDTSQSFWSPDGFAQIAWDNAAVASFTVAVPEAPLALLLGPALFAAAFPRRKPLSAR